MGPTLTGCLVLVAMVYGTSDSRTSILASGVPGTKFSCTCHITHIVWLGQKRLLLANVSNFPCRVLQIISISNETTAAVQSCPPSMIYAAKLRIRATTTIIRHIQFVQVNSYKPHMNSITQFEWITHTHTHHCRLWHRTPCS